jgi:hypothetical protein
MLVAFDILLAVSSVTAAAIQWRRWWHQSYTAELCANLRRSLFSDAKRRRNNFTCWPIECCIGTPALVAAERA